MSSPISIFLVEDNPALRQMLLEIIGDLTSAQVVGWADSEVDATAWLRAHHTQWDLAVVDLFLISGSGLGVLRSAKRESTQRMVVLSNYATVEIRRQCLAAGADAVFDKSEEVQAFTDYVEGMAIAT